MVNPQEWVDKKFPLNKRHKIAYLNLDTSWKNMSRGGLDLKGFINLKQLNLRDLEINQTITDLDTRDCKNLESIEIINTGLNDTDFLVSLPNPEKLTYLDISDNNFYFQDLSVFSRFTNLKELRIGNLNHDRFIWGNNGFYGSLKPLKNLTKLKLLDISDTDVNRGLEYLPESLEELVCEVEIKERINRNDPNYCVKSSSVSSIRDILEKYNYDIVAWRKENFNLIIDSWKKETQESQEKIKQLETELQMEREEAEKALQKAQEWRERQLKEITEQKDKEIEELKKQVSQLQSQLVSLQIGEQTVQILQTNLPTSQGGSY